MIVNQIDERVAVAHTEEIVFAGDGVRLDGQIDYPILSSRQKTFPLMFILHHAGCDDAADLSRLLGLARPRAGGSLAPSRRGCGRLVEIPRGG